MWQDIPEVDKTVFGTYAEALTVVTELNEKMFKR